MGKNADIHLLLLNKYPPDVGSTYESAIFLLNSFGGISLSNQHQRSTECNFIDLETPIIFV